MSAAQAPGARTPSSARRPYRKPVPRTWFLRTGEYRVYALREISSVVVALAVVDLLVGLIALQHGREAFAWWSGLHAHPLGLVLTVVALAMSLVQTATWFQAMPKFVRIRRGRRYIADRWVVLAEYVVLAVVTAAAVLWLAVA
ncbi:hypothetical protein N8K70_06975 [Microbacterium betulae]|uniref:Fumarate reductase subunit C n=1 Tax=Microbacterium betulae TaxID=2981139 RepID=A0AA97I7L4_9MICO|nr:hypothetical protein [Microbacterium sp. AB]WOF24402.1 hypothetical protein N8K70_06975 [Microbacterium sp. AB]